MKKVLITLLLFVIVLLGCGSPFIPDDVKYDQASILVYPGMLLPYSIYYTNDNFLYYSLYSVDWNAPRCDGVAETMVAGYSVVDNYIVIPVTNDICTNYSKVVVIWEIE